jgi:thymidylate synthase (FAD)
MHTATLVHITPNSEELIAYMARVSNPFNQNNTETSARLIKYLIDHQHWSPFEMVNMCVEINTTRSIAAQILRHRSFSFQEFSQRYAEVATTPVIPQLRRQDHTNRQNSIDDLDDVLKKNFQFRIGSLYSDCYGLYK